MAKFGAHFGIIGGHFDATPQEVEKAIMPGLHIAVTASIVGVCVKLIYQKLKNKYIGKSATEAQTKKPVISEEFKPKEKKASDYEVIQDPVDNGQLAGKLLYNDDICLWYGENTTAKTAIIMNLMMDVALNKKSSLMPDDKGIHPPCHAIFYNGEMIDINFQNFFGTFDRTLLDWNLDIIEDFLHLGVDKWCDHVQQHLGKVDSDALVVLDNISSLTSAMNGEAFRLMIAKLKSIREWQNKRGYHVAIILISHTNKSNEIIGSIQQTNLVDNVIRFEKNGDKHTKITIEKNRVYQDILGKSYDFEWITAPEGYHSFRNTGEISCPAQSGTNNINNPISNQTKPKSGRNSKISSDEIDQMVELRKQGFTDEEIGERFNCARETVNKKINNRLKESQKQNLVEGIDGVDYIEQHGTK